MDFLKKTVESIRRVSSSTGVQLDPKTFKKYMLGEYAGIVSYEKSRSRAEENLSPLSRYILAASSYVQHNSSPMEYYDIFTANRACHIINWLAKCLPTVEKISGGALKISKLVAAKTYDEFDSVFFEIATASRYAEVAEYVEFVENPGITAPDLKIKFKGQEYSVECKRVNRQTDYSVQIKNHIEDTVLSVAKELQRARQDSVYFEVEIICDPMTLSSDEIAKAMFICLKSPLKTKLFTNRFWLKAIPLSKLVLKEYVLHPSQQYYFDRYSYKEGGVWGGLVELMDSKRGLGHGHHPGSTWIDTVSWEFALKWKLKDGNTALKIQRINFGRLKKAYAQIKSSGLPGIIHYCFERYSSLGHRQEILINATNDLFTQEVAPSGIPVILVFHELEYEVTYRGQFDFREHTHYAGNIPSLESSIVNSVMSEATVSDEAPFGVGHTLPDLDDELEDD